MATRSPLTRSALPLTMAAQSEQKLSGLLAVRHAGARLAAVVAARWLRHSTVHSSPALRARVVAPVERATAANWLVWPWVNSRNN